MRNIYIRVIKGLNFGILSSYESEVMISTLCNKGDYEILY